jgi:anti-sigma factor RsiW
MKLCDRWREALAEHALGSAAAPELAEHLGRCAACSAALAKMQSLTGEIDRGIRQLAAAEPEADAATRILAEAGRRAVQTRWWQPTGRAVAAAIAAAVFLAASLGVLWKSRVQREDSERALSVAAEISSWKSPTRELLRSPYESVLKGTPRLGEGFYRLDASGVKTENSAPRAKEKQKQ